VRKVTLLFVGFALAMISDSALRADPTPVPITRAGWYLRVCHTSGRNDIPNSGSRIAFRFGVDQNSSNYFPDWDWIKSNPAAHGYQEVVGSDETDLPGGFLNSPQFWIKADSDPHGYDNEVCVMYKGQVKRDMKFSKDETHDVNQTDSGAGCGC